MERYFIRDCNNTLVGNPKGYRTYTGAARVEKQLYPMLWDRLDAKQLNSGNGVLVCTIKLETV